jgi:hypothetical protein
MVKMMTILSITPWYNVCYKSVDLFICNEIDDMWSTSTLMKLSIDMQHWIEFI